MKLRYSPRSLFTLFFIAISLYAIVSAWDWEFRIRLFPMLAAGSLLVLAVIQLVRETLLPATEEGQSMDFSFAEGIDPRVARRRMLSILGWIIGFPVAIWLFGFHIAIPAMMFLYLRFQGKESWVLSIALAVIAFLFFDIVFNRILHLLLPTPVLFGFS